MSYGGKKVFSPGWGEVYSQDGAPPAHSSPTPAPPPDRSLPASARSVWTQACVATQTDAAPAAPGAEGAPGGDEGLGDEDTLELCRLLSGLHYEMILFPSRLVADRLDTNLRPFYEDEDARSRPTLWLIVSLVVVAVLPGAYAQTMMDFPCKRVKYNVLPVDGASGAEALPPAVMLEKCPSTYCMAHTLLRTPALAARVGVESVLLAVMIVLLMAAATRALSNNALASRKLWLPWLYLWYLWIEPRAQRLRFGNVALIPSLYAPLSMLVCCLYLTIAAEMLRLGWQTKQLAIGGVSAYAVGELFLKLANLTLGGSAKVQMVTEAEVAGWRPQEAGYVDPGTQTVLQRLWATRKMQFALSSAELASLRELHDGRQPPKASPPRANRPWFRRPRLLGADRHNHTQGSPRARKEAKLGPVTTLYITDTNQVVDLAAWGPRGLGTVRKIGGVDTPPGSGRGGAGAELQRGRSDPRGQLRHRPHGAHPNGRRDM